MNIHWNTQIHILIIYLIIGMHCSFADEDKSKDTKPDTLDSLFSLAVTFQGKEYINVRNQLIANDKISDKFLKEKLNSLQWEERLTAEILLAWLQKKDDFKKFAEKFPIKSPSFPDDGIEPHGLLNSREYFFINNEQCPVLLLVELIWKCGKDKNTHWWIVAEAISTLQKVPQTERFIDVIYEVIDNRKDSSTIVKACILFLESKESNIQKLSKKMVNLLRIAEEFYVKRKEELADIKPTKQNESYIKLTQYEIEYTIKNINNEVKSCFLRNYSKNVLEVLREELKNDTNTKIKELLKDIIGEIEKKINNDGA